MQLLLEWNVAIMVIVYFVISAGQKTEGHCQTVISIWSAGLDFIANNWVSEWLPELVGERKIGCMIE